MYRFIGLSAYKALNQTDKLNHCYKSLADRVTPFESYGDNV